MAKGKEKQSKEKVPFGGYEVCFKGCTDTLEDLSGGAPIPPSDDQKTLDYVKRLKLATKG